MQLKELDLIYPNNDSKFMDFEAVMHKDIPKQFNWISLFLIFLM